MGRLIVGSEFIVALSSDLRKAPHAHLDPSWYFPDAHYDHRGEGWTYSADCGFPFFSAIHLMGWNKEIKVPIRRLVERSMLGSVLYTTNDLSYSYRVHCDSNGKRQSYNSKVHHLYHEFRFEELDDKILFDLSFAGVIAVVQERHPDYCEVTEEQIREAAYGLYT